MGEEEKQICKEHVRGWSDGWKSDYGLGRIDCRLLSSELPVKERGPSGYSAYSPVKKGSRLSHWNLEECTALVFAVYILIGKTREVSSYKILGQSSPMW